MYSGSKEQYKIVSKFEWHMTYLSLPFNNKAMLSIEFFKLDTSPTIITVKCDTVQV